MPGGYGAVIVDRPVGEPQSMVVGAVIHQSGRGYFAADGDPRFVVLSHPLEAEILAGTGYGWNDLLREGRYVSVTNVVCRRCGTVYHRRRLAPPGGFGCLTGVAGG